VDARSYGAGRLLLTRVFQGLVGRAFNTPVRDLTFAYKLGTRELFEAFDWESTGHEIALETTLRPVAAGFRVAEVPTRWRGREEGESHQPFRRNLRHVATAARIWAAPRS
jgi:hypothetical protein